MTVVKILHLFCLQNHNLIKVLRNCYLVIILLLFVMNFTFIFKLLK